MNFFRKKPVTIEARQFDGSLSSACMIRQWAHAGGDPLSQSIVNIHPGLGDDAVSLGIRTLEGEMTATSGSWIIKGVKGEFYPCKHDIFEATYEPAPDPNDFPLGKACDLSGEGSCEACQ